MPTLAPSFILVLLLLLSVPLDAQEPAFDLDSHPVFIQEGDDGISTRYAAVSLANALLGGLAAGVNMTTIRSDVPPRARSTTQSHAITLGMSAGGASMALGVVGLVRSGDERAKGAANLVVGAASAWVAYRAATSRTAVEVRPWLEPAGDVRAADFVMQKTAVRQAPVPRAGVQLSVTF
ncbi:MAG: hypothetical protein EA351_13520 [Gemmatimonadales bacterium]|nr:MAG: hypothetical protein EA351_13520 [Gemmatimonadales bacterium]